MTLVARKYRGVSSASGPLVTIDRTTRAALGEWVTIIDGAQEPRRGQIIDAGEDVSIVQILDETLGMSPGTLEATLTGEVARAVVGRELAGRVFSGAGLPLDDLPPPIGEEWRPLWGAPINPVRRRKPTDFIETGISAIDGLNTLVRGQKLPIFSGPGLPALELAAQIVEHSRMPAGEPFTVIFVAIGITQREMQMFLERFRATRAAARSILYLNSASDPTMERLLAPRLALAQAEFLAFETGTHVLVVLADMTNYCEALREVGAARGEIPGRRGYPGHMYTDLATIFERAGMLANREGSITQVPVLTMPDDDITHPIPDLTGYITEGQIVLDRDLHARGVFPPIDVLASLSRLMNAGIGDGKTVAEHREWADQLYTSYAQGREARLTAAIVGEAGLPEADRRAMQFSESFEREFVGQSERRSLVETFESGWKVLETLPRNDLARIAESTWHRRDEAKQ